jgi:hypothetical protein
MANTAKSSPTCEIACRELEERRSSKFSKTESLVQSDLATESPFNSFSLKMKSG